MSFLNQLKSKATELQSQQVVASQDLAASRARTEVACRNAAERVTSDLLDELAKLIVAQPSTFA